MLQPCCTLGQSHGSDCWRGVLHRRISPWRQHRSRFRQRQKRLSFLGRSGHCSSHQPPAPSPCWVPSIYLDAVAAMLCLWVEAWHRLPPRNQQVHVGREGCSAAHQLLQAAQRRTDSASKVCIACACRLCTVQSAHAAQVRRSMSSGHVAS